MIDANQNWETCIVARLATKIKMKMIITKRKSIFTATALHQ